VSNRIIRFHEYGSADVLKIEDLPLQEPNAGEVRIRVETLSLNRADVQFRQNQYVETPILPSRLGYEVAGTVEAIGEEVTSVKVGDKVSTLPAFSVQHYGTHSETAIVPDYGVHPIPPNLSIVEASAFWIQYLTGYYALVDLGKVQPGHYVAITAATSTTGIAAIQLTKILGAKSIATTRSAAKAEKLVEAGADYVIVTSKEDLLQRILEITDGKGAEVIYDAVAGPGLEALANATAKLGNIIVYGALDLSAPTPLPLFPAFIRTLKLHAGYKVFDFTGNQNMGIPRNEEAFARGKKFVYDNVGSGQLKPEIGKVFEGLDHYADAHRLMEADQVSGKIVVTV
jgi:NADPH:quinone reductase-like Zn-dependent oxidoreductase